MEHFVWDFDPEIFRVGSFGPRYYGLMFALGFLVSYRILEKMWKEEGRDLESLSSLLVHVMVGTILGARLGHCLFYDPAFYLSNPLEILKIWKGGLASHGGSLGVVFAVYLYSRKNPDQPYGWLCDRLATVLPFGSGCIRVGNFFNTEILGKPSDVPWAIVFKRHDLVPRHPAMLYEALTYFAVFIVVMFRYKMKGKDVRPGSQIGFILIIIFGSRFFLENYKENQVGFENAMYFNMGQLLSIPFVIAGILLFTGLYRKFMPSGYGYLLEEGGVPPTKPGAQTSKPKAEKKPKKTKRK